MRTAEPAMPTPSCRPLEVAQGDEVFSTTQMLRLCQLVSPALPIGAYNFSQGLELAVHREWVRDEASALEWIQGVARHSVTTLDLPILLRLHLAWQQALPAQVRSWSTRLIAARESAELRAEERHLGRSLAKVLASLQVPEAAAWTREADASYACLFALAADHWRIPSHIAAAAYLWAWCENQVVAALKLLPLGQTAGQRLLNQLLLSIDISVQQALAIADDEIGIHAAMPGMASAWHETQYSRLFRS